MPQIGLFHLSRELRDLIYVYYLTEEDGYHFDFASGRLRSKQGPIDLSLMYTCRAIAAEMKGLALKLNQITIRPEPPPVSTGLDDDVSLAERFQLLADGFHEWQETISDVFPTCVCDDIMEEVAQRFPGSHTVELIESFRNNEISQLRMDETDDVKCEYDDVLSYTLKLAASHPDFMSLANANSEYNDLYIPESEINAFDFPCPWWSIPTESDLTLWEEKIGLFRPERDHSTESYYFSATATMIRFLQLLPAETRSHLRKVVIIEDCGIYAAAVGHPPCHARGLIPFCRENRNLHFERRVDVWNHAIYGHEYREETKDLREWIAEALTLAQLGMPPGSFSLILEDAPQKSHDGIWLKIPLIHSLKEGAAMHEAVAVARKRGQLPGVYQSVANHERLPLWNFMDDFPQIVKDILQGKSVISIHTEMTNYSDLEEVIEKRRKWHPQHGSATGNLLRNASSDECWDVEEILKARAGWSVNQWHTEWIFWVSLLG